MKIQIINGPNINLLGKREPSIYGSVTFEDYLVDLRKRYVDVEIGYFQSNIEGEMIDCIQRVGFDVDGIILNAGAYTHTSIALQAQAIIDTCRKDSRLCTLEICTSITGDVTERIASCKGVICGFGLNSYRLALEALLDR